LNNPASNSSVSQAKPLSLFRAWWPAAVWLLLITFESTDFFSSKNTGTSLYFLLTRIFGEINLYDFLTWHAYLRKAGHVVGYGMLCLLLLRGWRATLARTNAWHASCAVLAWVVTALVASLDEWHQSFIPSRTGSPKDVLLDSVAGLAFLLVAYLWLRRPHAAEQAA
jgi:VanZ family protein